MDRTKDNEPAAYLFGLRLQPIDTGLQVRAELLIALAIEVLKFVKNQDEASFRHRLQQPCELQQIIGPGMLAKNHRLRSSIRCSSAS
jgi:hypothetical protein